MTVFIKQINISLKILNCKLAKSQPCIVSPITIKTTNITINIKTAINTRRQQRGAGEVHADNHFTLLQTARKFAGKSQLAHRLRLPAAPGQREGAENRISSDVRRSRHHIARQVAGERRANYQEQFLQQEKMTLSHVFCKLLKIRCVNTV